MKRKIIVFAVLFTLVVLASALLLCQRGNLPQVLSVIPKSSNDVFKNAQEVLSRPTITFYGRVIDDNGVPTSGVKVLGFVTYPEGFVRTHTETHTTTTDAEGLFTFKGLHGADITIEPRNEAYNSRQKTFFYSLLREENKRHKPDAKNPIVFVIQKRLGAEPMISHRIDFSRIPVDGTSVRFDLETGKKVATGGDLEIAVKWDSEIKFLDRFRDWSVRLAVPNGGLIKRTRDMLFLAPASGYSPFVEYKFQAETRESGISAEEFVLESRNGKNHARIQLYLDNDWLQNRATVTLRSWLNPSSSRNLEYDPAKSIKVSR